VELPHDLIPALDGRGACVRRADASTPIARRTSQDNS
jgi:hypothetical protein